jgi:hypothetical protein
VALRCGGCHRTNPGHWAGLARYPVGSVAGPDDDGKLFGVRLLLHDVDCFALFAGDGSSDSDCGYASDLLSVSWCGADALGSSVEGGGVVFDDEVDDFLEACSFSLPLLVVSEDGGCLAFALTD